MRSRFLALVLILAAPGARAEPVPDFVKDSLGSWLAVTDDGKPGCRITLEAGSTIGGRIARPEPACAARLPRLSEATAWTYERGVRLHDATRRIIARFEEDETTLLKTRGDEVPATLLVRARPGVERAPFAPDLYGTWAMRRPDGPTLCEVTLRRTPPPGGEESFALTPGPACDPAVARLKLASWRVEDFALMLYGTDGASLRFEPGPEGYDKAEGGKPLRLVRLR
ncbi:AprI/Inh family metalloprotease inhibitor [Methylobacterium trifolii]|uniref:Alkaline proteinase inhibitor/ Outer membrane lipoprotein Omp19 domain-containing protein n=1 Tax=Methylobacterium trifolii TaxID=1003092 RepID=A0ABQ4TXG6_9HYPH|nr:AprI/Inh family metalloprotease inhibitor [Methylobacterium trifolii]GJE59367.1 hypothetical protein MPOCJGCO_1458 [Methylobacterium trifolii]